MQVVIELPEDKFDLLQAAVVCGADRDWVHKAVAIGTILPEKPTNGDIIKVLFPQDEEVILDTVIFKLNGSKCRVSIDWWNAEYKKDGE